MSPAFLRGVLRLAAKNTAFRRLLIADLRGKKGFVHLPVGESRFFGKSNLDVHRGRDHVTVTDMTNAGKRGKKVPYFVVMFSEMSNPGEEIMGGLISSLAEASSYKDALKTAEEMTEDIKLPGYDGKARQFLRMYEREKRGIDVVPASSSINMDTAQFTFSATPNDFSLRDKKDTYNRPVAIPSSRAGKTQAKKFFAWLTQEGNLARLEGMSFQKVVDKIEEVTGQLPHTWSSMD